MLLGYLKRRLRFQRAKAKFLKFGSFLDISEDSVFVEPERISFGDNVFINRFAIVSGSVCFGSNIMIGPRFTCYSDNHSFGRIGQSIMQYSKEFVRGNVNIEDEVWIGSDVKIYGSIRIGMGSIIGGGSVLTKDVPPFSVVVGNGRIVKQVFSVQEVNEHLKILGYPNSTIQDVIVRMAQSSGREN